MQIIFFINNKMHPYEDNKKVLGKQLGYEVNFMIIDRYMGTHIVLLISKFNI